MPHHSQKVSEPAVISQAKKTSAWRYLALIVGLVVVVAGSWGVWQSILRRSIPVIETPTIDTEGVDIEVVEAIDRSSAKVNANPHEASDWGQLGMIFFAHEFNSQAASCFDQAALLDPSNPRWPYLRGRCVALHRPDEAAEHLARAVALCENEPAAPRLSRIEILLELMRLEEAESELDKFMKANDRDPRARLAHARLLFMQERFQDSLNELVALDRQLTKDELHLGRRQSLYLLIAASLRRLGKPEEAEKMRLQAMEQGKLRWPDEYMDEVGDCKTGLKTYLVEADLLYGRQEYERSIRLLRDTLKKYPDSIWGKILLARALIRTGAPDGSLPAKDKEQRLSDAVRHLEEALVRDPNSVEAKFRLAVAKTYQGDVPAAVDLYEEAIRLKPDFTMAHYNLASCRSRLKDMQGAIEALEASVAAEPDFVDGHFMLGRLMMNERNYAEATKHLAIANRLRPKDRRIAELYMSASQMSEILSD